MKRNAILWSMLALGVVIVLSTVAVVVALTMNTAAVQQQDYHACIIASAEHVNPSDYGADTAHDIARQCRAIAYGEERER